MNDPTSDLTFRPASPARRARHDDAWEAVVRQELRKLRLRSPSRTRVVPASRARPAETEANRSAAA